MNMIIPPLPTYTKVEATPATPASDKQVAYIISLSEQRDMATVTNPKYIDTAITLAKTQPNLLAKHIASTTIDALVRCPKLASKSVQQPASKAGLEDGYYTFNDKTIKIVRSPQTGNLYAKELTVSGWEYSQGTVYQMKNPAKYGTPTKLTVEEAGKLGHIYGRCIICSRTLTDEYSIANGIGPVCAGKL